MAWDCFLLCIALYVYLRMRVRGEALFGIITFYMVAAVRVGREKNGSR